MTPLHCTAVLVSKLVARHILLYWGTVCNSSSQGVTWCMFRTNQVQACIFCLLQPIQIQLAFSQKFHCCRLQAVLGVLDCFIAGWIVFYCCTQLFPPPPSLLR